MKFVEGRCSFDHNFHPSRRWFANEVDQCRGEPATRDELEVITGGDWRLRERIDLFNLCELHAEQVAAIRSSMTIGIERRQAVAALVGICPVCGAYQNRHCGCVSKLTRPIASELRREIELLRSDLQSATSQRVYVLRSMDDLSIAKIGTGVKPEDRLSYWRKRTGHDMAIAATTPGGRALESDLHRRFGASRMNVDWGTEFFRWTKHLAAFIHDTFDDINVGVVNRAFSEVAA